MAIGRVREWRSRRMSGLHRLVGIAAGLALVAGLGSAPVNAASQPMVVGGDSVSFADVPWQVLFIMNEESVCGGSLVSSTQVLSAAHCFADYPVSQVAAWTGISKMEDRSNSTRLTIKSITIHPDFNATTFANDIAIVTLSAPVSGALGAATVGLPASQDPAAWPAADAAAIVSGWGETDPAVEVASNDLQAAVVDVLAAPGAAACGSYGGTYLPDLQICAGVAGGGVDACQGDSGGPLTVSVNGEPILAGISSTGFECGSASYPGLYVRVTTYLPWLASNGIDVRAAGGESIIEVPGSDRDGELANFRVGQTYERAVFARYAGMSATKSRLKVTSGKACTQVGQSVRIDAAGKCRITVSRGSKKVPMVLTVYSN